MTAQARIIALVGNKQGIQMFLFFNKADMPHLYTGVCSPGPIVISKHAIFIPFWVHSNEQLRFDDKME